MRGGTFRHLRRVRISLVSGIFWSLIPRPLLVSGSSFQCPWAKRSSLLEIGHSRTLWGRQKKTWLLLLLLLYPSIPHENIVSWKFRDFGNPIFTTQTFSKQKGVQQNKKFLRAARAKKGYSKKRSKQKGIQYSKKISSRCAPNRGTIKSFLSKKGCNKVKNFFALRALKRGIVKRFLSKKGYNRVKYFRAARKTGVQ